MGFKVFRNKENGGNGNCKIKEWIGVLGIRGIIVIFICIIKMFFVFRKYVFYL